MIINLFFLYLDHQFIQINLLSNSRQFFFKFKYWYKLILLGVFHQISSTYKFFFFLINQSLSVIAGRKALFIHININN